MTGDQDGDSDWADRYLRDRLEGTNSEASAEHGPPPEAADYMDGLTDADLSYVHPDNRSEHLETALVRAMEAEGVAEPDLHGRPAAAFDESNRVVSRWRVSAR